MAVTSNLVHETSTGTGTGNIDLVNVNGKQSFNSAFSTGGTNVFYYFISNRDVTPTEWEVGTGHMSDSDTLVRDTVLASSNTNNPVNFTAGTKDVTSAIPVSQLPQLSAANVWTAAQSVYADNSSTTPLIKAEQDGVGDASYTALLTGGVQWTWGIDNSVSGDPWKLSASAALGTTDVLHITTGGSVGIGATPALVGTSMPQTDVLHVVGQIRSVQGGNGDGDGCFATAFGFMSGANWSGNVMFGSNLLAHSTGGADKYKTPYAGIGYVAVECVGAQINFYANSAAATAGADVTPTKTGQVSSAGAWAFPLLGTTASAANAFLDSGSSPANNLLRSTSSIRYKTDVRDLEAADSEILSKLRPIKYRSRAKADDPRKEHFGLIAEEVHEVDPRLVHYTKDMGRPVPDGVQYERIIPLLIHRIQYLEKRMSALEAGSPSP